MLGCRLAELGLLLGLAVLALALRLPYYQDLPAWSDEVDEIYLAVQMVQGQVLPLVGVSAYLGTLWTYLLAATFWVGGFNVYAPRTLILVIAVLTVLATYPLGQAWSGGRRRGTRRIGGLLAAVLLATSPEHIVIGSHIAWSNCVTPLLTTLAIAALWRAVAGRGSSQRSANADRDQRRAGIWLALSGLCWGLALQTHPTVLALLPGAAAFLVCQGRPLLRTRWPYLAAALFVLVNLPLVVNDLTNGFASISEGLVRSSSYTRNEQLSPAVYVGRLAKLLTGLVRYLGGGIDQRQLENPEQILGDPGLWPMSLLAVVGLVWQWRRGNRLPTLLVLSMTLILPLFSRRFESVQAGRYLAPLFPVLYAGIGVLLAAGLDRFASAQRRRRNAGLWPAQLWPACIWLLAAFLALHPLLYLRSYYEQDPRIGGTNAAFFQTIERIRANRPAGEIVIIDRPARERTVGWGGALPSNAFQLFLVLDHLPYRLADLDSGELLEPGNRCHDQLVLPSMRRPEEIEAIAARLGLRPLGQPPVATYAERVEFPLYRLDRLPSAPPDC